MLLLRFLLCARKGARFYQMDPGLCGKLCLDRRRARFYQTWEKLLIDLKELTWFCAFKAAVGCVRLGRGAFLCARTGVLCLVQMDKRQVYRPQQERTSERLQVGSV